MFSFREIKRRYDRGHYVRNPDYDEELYNCVICLEPVSFPVRCVKCKLLACKVCADKIIQNSQTCPKKCQPNKWEVTEQKPTGLELKCPYDARCEAKLYPQTFDDHLMECSFIPEEFKNVKTEKELKEEYMCKDGHPLSFVGYDRVNLVYKGCIGCEKKNLTRSYCNTCDQGFCSGCRYPKGLTTVKCPLGHLFLIRNQLFCVTCDFCSESTRRDGMTYCYNDPKCDYAVCLKCYEKLEKEKKEGDYEKEDPNINYRV